MTDSDNRAYTTHDSALMLLPWYINGSLDNEQQELVDKHLTVCLTCRSELNTHRRIAEAVKSRDAASLGADIGFAQMRRRIQSDRRSPSNHLRDRLGRNSLTPAWIWASGVAVAASILIVLPLLHGLGGPVNVPGEFRTLSTNNGHLDFHANSLRLIFSAGLEDEARQDILRMVNTVAVTAPSSHGVLTVQVPEGELASALALLRDRKEVRLAEPVFSATDNGRE